MSHKIWASTFDYSYKKKRVLIVEHFEKFFVALWSSPIVKLLKIFGSGNPSDDYQSHAGNVLCQKVPNVFTYVKIKLAAGNFVWRIYQECAISINPFICNQTWDMGWNEISFFEKKKYLDIKTQYILYQDWKGLNSKVDQEKTRAKASTFSLSFSLLIFQFSECRGLRNKHNSLCLRHFQASIPKRTLPSDHAII